MIDGGGNIGLFTLRAAAGLEGPGDASVRFVICEPVPENVEQIRKHLALNGDHAEIMPFASVEHLEPFPFTAARRTKAASIPLSHMRG